MTKHLVLGGARSGKSSFAENLAIEYSESEKAELSYIATAQALDEEMKARILHHQRGRDKRWTLIEEPLHLSEVLLHHDSPRHCLLVDCLTLWLSNCIHRGCWDEEMSLLLKCLPELQGHLVLVSNEVGSGVVPMGEMSREFVDAAGRLHQALAAYCQNVTLVVAGLPLELKNSVEG